MKRWLRRLLLAAFAVTLFGVFFAVHLRAVPLHPLKVLTPCLPPETVISGFSDCGDQLLVHCWKVDPNGYLMTEWPYGHLHVWDISSGRLQSSFRISRENLSQMKLSPDGKYIAALGNPLSLQLMTVRTGEVLHVPGFAHWDTTYGYQGATTFSPDGRYLAYSACFPSQAAVVVVWDIDGRCEVCRFRDEHAPMAFSADGETLATSRAGPDPRFEQNVTNWNLMTRAPQSQVALRFHSRDPWRNRGQEAGVLESADVTITDPGTSQELARFKGFVSLGSNAFHLSARAEGGTPFHSLSPKYLSERERDLLRPFSDDPLRPPMLRRSFHVERHSYFRDVGQPWRWLAESLLGYDFGRTGHRLTIRDTRTGKPVAVIEDSGRHHLPTPKGDRFALLSDHGIQIWDLPPRRPVGLLSLLAAVPTLLFTVLLWWRWYR
jgi:WD40 repeat protein